VNIKVNSTVPMIDIYAQTPTAESAAALANAAVDELKAYMADVTAAQDIPLKDQVRPIQLGRATGVVLNRGVKWQAAIIVFLLTFGISCATVTYLGRVRTGWRAADLSERAAEA
jgi:capsular polysaccharide biosynthesis protein